MLNFDYVIVGAGSAVVCCKPFVRDGEGCADRSGSDQFQLGLSHSYACGFVSGPDKWSLQLELSHGSEPYLNNRQLYCPRGKVLGVLQHQRHDFCRGNRSDYDRWADLHRLNEWQYDQCLPYFRKSETVHFDDSQYRGDLGPLQVSGKLNNPLFNAWLDSASQAGYPLTTDFNGQQQEGAGPFDQTIYRGRRQSTAELI